MSDADGNSVGQHDKPTEKEGEPRQRHKRASAAALIDAFVDEYRTDRKAHNRRENHRVAREWLTIVGLFFAAGFAFLQWLELGKTDKNIAAQLAEMKQNNVLTNPPRVFISSNIMVGPDEGELWVTNSGNSDAIIRQRYCYAFWHDDIRLPERPPHLGDRTGLSECSPLKARWYGPEEVEKLSPGPPAAWTFRYEAIPGKHFFVIGFIFFDDRFGVRQHHFGFARMYDPDQRKFIRIEQSAYDQED